MSHAFARAIEARFEELFPDGNAEIVDHVTDIVRWILQNNLKAIDPTNSHDRLVVFLATVDKPELRSLTESWPA